MTIYYFGCWENPGHEFRTPGGRVPTYSRLTVDMLVPWGFQVDGGLVPKDTNHYGVAQLHHKDGWTAFSFRDNTVDTRPGSVSTFCMEGTYTFQEALDIAREHFPDVFARYPFEIVEYVPPRFVALFYGSREGVRSYSGHGWLINLRGGTASPRREQYMAQPWGYDVDGKLAPQMQEEPEGIACLHHKDGWTALSFWDRSADKRKGSVSTFCFHAQLSFEEAVKAAEEFFPAVVNRYPFDIISIDEIAGKRT